MIRAYATLLVIATALPIAAGAAAAQDWPTRPVRIVNTFAAGGTADVLARTVADHLSGVFKQQFFVETRAGAGGAIGVQSVAASAPDGYNFALTNVSLLVLRGISDPKLGYHPTRDLVNIAYIAGSPVVLSVNAGSGMATLQDFIVRAKTNPKPFAYSSSGVGSMGHLVAESFASKAGIAVEHVPYKGAAQGLMDLVGGHIMFASQTVSSTAALMRGGKLRGLAITAHERMADYAELPTFKELGFPDLISTIWFALSAPAGLPADIVAKVNREVGHAMRKPDVAQRVRQDGMITQTMSVAELAKYIDDEYVRWKPVVEKAGLVPK
jgi:tripartite-type tricarboxylate transporter receptor subunit TctC